MRAIGETGLDFYRTQDEAGRAAQFRSFEAHIEIAKQRGLALQIHDRDAHREVVETLRRVGAPERTVFHCFSGDAEFAKLVSDEGWFLSFAGHRHVQERRPPARGARGHPAVAHPDRDRFART